MADEQHLAVARTPHSTYNLLLTSSALQHLYTASHVAIFEAQKTQHRLTQQHHFMQDGAVLDMQMCRCSIHVSVAAVLMLLHSAHCPRDWSSSCLHIPHDLMSSALQ
jgi:hypothetical protein